MKRILLFSFMFMCLFAFGAFAQRTVTGNVTSADDGSTVPGVNVVVKGTTSGTTTDLDGNYRISVPEEGGTLVFSFIGLTAQEIQVGARSVIDVSMESDVQQLTEVVVTAFGIEREKKALTYSVQEVSNDQITKAGTPNTVNALQGKVAGVQVNQSSGMPGSSSFMRIRGSNSFNSDNQPLFVVDGMPIASNPSSSGGVSGVDYSSRSLDLNPEDIASISVLKGASAAALYGLRASNGVVIITTKSGKNLKPGTFRVNVSQSYSMDQVTRTPEVQGIYAQGSNGQHSRTASTSWGPRIDQLGDPAYNAFALTDGSNQYVNNVGDTVSPQKYDNINPLFEDGFTSVTNLDITGSTSSGSYAASIGYTNQDGIVPTSGMSKINTKVGGEFKLSDKFKTGGSLNFIFNDIDKVAGGSNLSNVLFTTYWAPRSYDLWGTPYNVEGEPYSQIHYRGAMDNPRWSLANNRFKEKITRSFGNTYFNYAPLDWLSFNYRAGIDAFTEERKEVYELGAGETGGRTSPPSGGQIYDVAYVYRQLNSNFNISINKELSDDFILDVLLGNELIDIRTSTQSVTGTSLTIGGFGNMANTSNQVVDNGVSSQRTVGFFANTTLSFRESVFLNLTGRQDYVSNMPRGNRSFFYPSAGLTVIFTDLFDISNDVLSFGKIRASYAEVGQAGPINSAQVPYLQASVGTGFTSDGIAFPFNGVNGFQQSNTLRDPDLKPQNNQTYELGLNLQFFTGRVGIDATYFNEVATDQIFTVPLPTSSGYSSILRNAGELKNSGIELSVDLNPVKVGDFSWNILTNYTQYESEVVSLADGVDNIFLGGFTEPNVRAFAGQPYPIIFGSRFLRDDDGNIVVDNRQFINGSANASYGMPVSDPTNGPIGQVNPDFEVGLTNRFTFKGLVLNVHIDMRKGGKAYAGNTRLQKLYGLDEVTEDRETPTVLNAVKGYYTQDNDGTVNVEAEGPNDIAIVRGQRFWNTVMDGIDESNVYDTDFFRLREIHLGYDLPKSVLSNTFIRSLNVYVVARNLLLLTKYPNFDPETSVGGASNFQGLEYVNLPQMKSFGAGVRIGL